MESILSIGNKNRSNLKATNPIFIIHGVTSLLLHLRLSFDSQTFCWLLKLIYVVYSTVVQTCEENICENGGNCTRHVNDYTCMCSPGFSGFLWEEGMPFTRVCQPQKLNHSLGMCMVLKSSSL